MTNSEALERALEEERSGTISDEKRSALQTLRRLGKIGEVEQPTAPPAAIEPYIWNQAKKGFTGPLGLAGDAVDLAHGFLGGPQFPNAQNPISVGDTIRKGWQGLLGVQDMRAPSKNAEIIGKGAEVLGAALPVSPIAAFKQSRPMLGLLAETGSVLGQAGGRMVGGLLAEPASELGLRYGMDPQKVGGLVEGTAETIGAFAPMASAYGISQGVRRGEELIGGWRNAGKRKAASDLAASLNFPGVGDNIARAQELESSLGLKFDLAQASGSPALRVIAGRLAERSPTTMQQNIAREAENLRALEGRKADLQSVPAEEGLAPARQRGAAVMKGAAEDADIVREQYETLTRSTLPSRDPSQVGAELRTMIDDRYAKADQKFSQAYDELASDANRAGVKMDISDVVNYVKTTFGSDAMTYQRPDMPTVFRQIYERHIAKEGATPVVSFNEYRSLMKEAAKDQRLAKGRSDFAPGHLKELNDQLHSQLDSFAESGQVPEQFANRLKGINSAYRSEIVDVYKKGVIGKLRQEGRFGEAVKDEDIVAKQFFKPNSSAGSATAMQDYMRLFGNDPNAAKLLEDGVLNVLTGPSGVLKDGLVDASKVKAFVAKYKNAISQNPLLARRMDTVASISDLIAKKNAAAQESVRAFNESAFATIIGKDAPTAIAESVRNPEELSKLASLAKTQRAKAGLVSGLSAHIYKQKDPLTFLKENEATLKPIFNQLGPGHWKNVIDLAEADNIMARVPAPQTSQSQKEWDFLKDLTGISSPSAGARVRAVRHGRSSAPQEALSAGVEILSKRADAQYMKAMEAAIYHPDLAAALASVTKAPMHSTAKMNDIKRHLLSAGIRVMSTEDYIPQ